MPLQCGMANSWLQAPASSVCACLAEVVGTDQCSLTTVSARLQPRPELEDGPHWEIWLAPCNEHGELHPVCVDRRGEN